MLLIAKEDLNLAKSFQSFFMHGNDGHVCLAIDFCLSDLQENFAMAAASYLSHYDVVLQLPAQSGL